jgi:hypothetical protein
MSALPVSRELPDSLEEYYDFLRRTKQKVAAESGVDVDPEEINPRLQPFTRDTVRWKLAGGCRANFSSFGLRGAA